MSRVKIDNLHACIAVANLEESIRWYCDILGFRVMQQHDFAEFHAKLAFLESNGIEIELVESENCTQLRRLNPPIEHVRVQGISQLSFRVHRIEEALSWAQEHSIEIALDLVNAEPLQLKAFFIRDNEGNLIEFIERYGN